MHKINSGTRKKRKELQFERWFLFDEQRQKESLEVGVTEFDHTEMDEWVRPALDQSNGTPAFRVGFPHRALPR